MTHTASTESLQIFQKRKDDEYMNAYNKRKLARESIFNSIKILFKILIGIVCLVITVKLIIFIGSLWVPYVLADPSYNDSVNYFMLTFFAICGLLLSLIIMYAISILFYKGFIYNDKEAKSFLLNIALGISCIWLFFKVPYYIGYLLTYFNSYLDNACEKDAILYWFAGFVVLLVSFLIGLGIYNLFLLIYEAFKPLPNKVKREV